MFPLLLGYMVEVAARLADVICRTALVGKVSAVRAPIRWGIRWHLLLLRTFPAGSRVIGSLGDT